MRIQARETNYGTRIDYILATKGLLKWIKHGDIQPSVKGSDHCPIYIDLHDEITLDSGETVKLRDAMKQCHEPDVVPRLAAKNWEEFSGKQTLLSTFFGKKSEVMSPTDSPPDSSQPARSPSVSATAPQVNAEDNTSTLTHKASSSRLVEMSKKRSISQVNSSSAAKKQKKDPGQQTLGSFFSKPSAKTASGNKSQAEIIELDSDPEQPTTYLLDRADNADQVDADYRLACELASSQENTSSPSSTPPTRLPSESKAAWANVFAPVKPPNCTVHGEPARRYTVNKPGPNKGRTFYLCSRYGLSLV